MLSAESMRKAAKVALWVKVALWGAALAMVALDLFRLADTEVVLVSMGILGLLCALVLAAAGGYR